MISAGSDAAAGELNGLCIARLSDRFALIPGELPNSEVPCPYQARTEETQMTFPMWPVPEIRRRSECLLFHQRTQRCLAKFDVGPWTPFSGQFFALLKV